MKNLFKALANFQNEVPVILKDTQAYGYKYADLPAVFYHPGFCRLLGAPGAAWLPVVVGIA